ncbi:MAG: 50S ribosomal protein L25 [Bacteroidales bacterium]
MKTISISGNLREISTKSALKELRKKGFIPCNLYGNNLENILFSVDERQILKLTHTPNAYIIELDIEGKQYNSILQAVQFHPLTDKALHVDFLAVTNEKPVSIEVPVILEGSPIGVKEGGKLMVNSRKLRISASLDKLPDNIKIDVSQMKIGSSIAASDIAYEGVQILTPQATIICSVGMTRAAVGAAAALSTEEAQESAEGAQEGEVEGEEREE